MPATPEDIVREWLASAEEDYLVATRLTDIPGPAAFHVQQSAEKALKAELVRQGTRPPRTHDLVRLREQIGDDLEWTRDTAFLAVVTSWNVAFRYVDHDRPAEASTSELRDGLASVRSLIDEVRSKLDATKDDGQL